VQTSPSTAGIRDSSWSWRFAFLPSFCFSPQTADISQFVQSLANPQYLNYLASRKFLTNPAFIAYLDYLQYWTRAPYLKYLTFPTATLKMLELLQQEKFRQDIISPDLAQALIAEGMKTAVEWHREG
jgi:mediator of RNA polymerase II transcription subunit 31